MHVRMYSLTVFRLAKLPGPLKEEKFPSVAGHDGNRDRRKHRVASAWKEPCLEQLIQRKDSSGAVGI